MFTGVETLVKMGGTLDWTGLFCSPTLIGLLCTHCNPHVRSHPPPPVHASTPPHLVSSSKTLSHLPRSPTTLSLQGSADILHAVGLTMQLSLNHGSSCPLWGNSKEVDYYCYGLILWVWATPCGLFFHTQPREWRGWLPTSRE